MKNFVKKLFSNEPMIIWFRYFFTLNWKYIISNFIIPLIFCVVLGILKYNTLTEINIDIFTISSIFIGFAISALIMLLTTNNSNTQHLREIKIKNTKISLHQAMIYKFSYIINNLVFLILFQLILKFFLIVEPICVLISLFILINSLFTIIEATSNIIFTYINIKN